MEQTSGMILRRKISLWGTILVILLYILFYIIGGVPAIRHSNMIDDLTDIYFYFFPILFFAIAPLMQITGIILLWKQPIPQKIMHWKAVIFSMRFFLLLVYASQLFIIYAMIMNLFFLS